MYLPRAVQVCLVGGRGGSAMNISHQSYYPTGSGKSSKNGSFHTSTARQDPANSYPSFTVAAFPPYEQSFLSYASFGLILKSLVCMVAVLSFP